MTSTGPQTSQWDTLRAACVCTHMPSCTRACARGVSSASVWGAFLPLLWREGPENSMGARAHFQ